MPPCNAAAIISTRRADIASKLASRLQRQSRPPDHIFIVGDAESGIEQVAGPEVTACIGGANLPSLRNQGLERAGDAYRYPFFFDDDYVPSRRWIEQALEFFEKRPDVVALAGLKLSSGRSAVGIDITDPETIVGMLDDSVRTADPV